MDAREWRFAFTISGAHGVDHFLKRVFPPLVPIWAVYFGFPLWKLGLLLGASTLGAALAQAPMGHLADRYDRRMMLPTGIGLMGVCFMVFPAISGSPTLSVEFSLAGVALNGQLVAMLLTMFVIGIGSSTLHPIGYPLISENVSEDRKGTVLGMWGSARAFGDAAAPAVVGVGLLLTGWQMIVVIFGMAGILYAIYLFFALGPLETRPAQQIAAESESGSIQTSIWEVDRRIFVYPVLAVFVAFILQVMAAMGAIVFLPEFITSEYGYSFLVAGFTVTPESTASFYYSALLLTAGIVQIGTGRLVDRYDMRIVLLLFLAAGTMTLVVLAEFVFSAIGLMVVLLLLGASIWGLYPVRDALVSEITPADYEGRTFGYLWTGGLVISSVSPAFIGHIGDVAGLRPAFLLLAGLTLASMVPIALLFSDQVYTHHSRAEPVGSD